MNKRTIEAMADDDSTTVCPSPGPTILQNLSTVDYESKIEQEASKYSVAWSNSLDKGHFRNSTAYQKVNVLLLRWADSSDDIKVTKEVDDLKNVFEERFNFHAEVKLLDTTIQKKLQVQINAIIAGFVDKHDGQDTLLIVYYAGHGKPGHIPGQLELFGKRSPNDAVQAKKLDSVIWNQSEDMLRPADADILEIFDCCYAGTLGQTRGQPRFFEYLAATSATEVTPRPGKTSFTSALIHALKRMLETKPEGRFTTSELLTEINNAPHFSRDQRPVMMDREDVARSGRIMLHPLSRKNSSRGPSSAAEVNINHANQHALTLHFDYDHKPSVENVTELGDHLISMFNRNTLKVNGIRWGGVQPSMVTRVMHRFTNIINRKRREKGVEIDIGKGWPPPDLLTPVTDGEGHSEDLFTSDLKNSPRAERSPPNPRKRRKLTKGSQKSSLRSAPRLRKL